MSEYKLTHRLENLNLNCDNHNNELINKEIREYLMLQMVFNIVKNIKAKKLNLDENSTNNIRNALLRVKIENLNLDNLTDPLLGLNEYKDVQLSYIEKKTLKQQVIEEIKKKYEPIFDLIKEMKTKHPSEDDDNLFILENERRSLQNILIEKEIRTNELLHQCINIRTSTLLSNEFEMLLSEYKLNYLKTSTMHTILLQENCSRTLFIHKAIKEVENDIDKLLDADKTKVNNE